MSKEMTTRERMLRIINHQEADRIPIFESPWKLTRERWFQEGLPRDTNFADYFGWDKFGLMQVDITPRYPITRIHEDDKYITETHLFGGVWRNPKDLGSVPEYISYTITTPEKWEECKQRMLTGENRIDWDKLKTNYALWQKEGRWIQAQFIFGFDQTHCWVDGLEHHLIAMLEEPEMIRDMYETFLDCNIKLYQQIWDAGYKFDAIYWPDDMGYKNTTFFSREIYRELLKPVQKRAIDWAHNLGVKTHLHADGYIMPFMEDLAEIGLDMLNPLEVKAGMKPLEIKEKYGHQLTLQGGMDVTLWDDKDQAIEAIRSNLPTLMKNGGYVFHSDHSCPPSVSLENYKAILAEAKRIGTY